MANQVPWSELKPFSNDPILHTGLRFEKIKVKKNSTFLKDFICNQIFNYILKALLTINLKSQCFDEKKDAIKVRINLETSLSIFLVLKNIFFNLKKSIWAY